MISLQRFLNKILCGDAYSILRQIPDRSIDCIVTSPPYWQLRNYDTNGQLGLELTVDEYLAKLFLVFDELKRILKDQGTCWVVLGDTYAGDSPVRKSSSEKFVSQSKAARRQKGAAARSLPKKSLAQIPARFAIGMAERGWLLRNEIIWHKPSCMPASAKDRFTVDYEKVFFFVKSKRYYFEQQFEPLRNPQRLTHRSINPSSARKRRYGNPLVAAINPQSAEASRRRVLLTGRNKRCVWTVATRPFKGQHFAVFPQKLIETPIKAGCQPGGVVLDPFIGSGTTALVARELGRQFAGIEINPKYVQIAHDRLSA